MKEKDETSSRRSLGKMRLPLSFAVMVLTIAIFAGAVVMYRDAASLIQSFETIQKNTNLAIRRQDSAIPSNLQKQLINPPKLIIATINTEENKDSHIKNAIGTPDDTAGEQASNASLMQDEVER